jgi:ABC-2 type transport system ATP-binding protein
MIIECERLAKRFRRHEAVRDVTLSVPKGAAVALVGANGAGKTTTLRTLLNILSPDSGSARLLGIESTKLTPKDFWRIGYVSENSKLPERMTIAQYMGYVRTLYPNWDRALEQQLLRQFELPPDRPLGKLSHGMRMKAMLTAALSFRPELLLMDEPLSGLDPLVRDEVMEGLLAQAGETTIVISSHELSEIEGCATHIAYMDRGRVVIYDTMEAVTARFRQVTATLGPNARPGVLLPTTWLSPTTTGQVVTFVDRAFSDDDALRRQLTEHYGSVQVVTAEPMSLRDLSKALMRASRSGVLQ